MRLRNTALQFLLLLILLQSGVALASSTHTSQQTSSDTEVSCHHHEMKMVEVENSSCASDDMAKDSCCNVSCQCSSASCTAASFIIPLAMPQSLRVDLATTFSLYTFVLQQTIQNSLFRPPIYS